MENENVEHNIPTIEDRRRQLEAFQAERALNKSRRASTHGSVRPFVSVLQSSPSNQSVRNFQPRRSILTAAGSTISAKDEQASKAESISQESSTRRIIRQYDELSKSNNGRPTTTGLGVRRNGTTPFRVEKKLRVDRGRPELLPGRAEHRQMTTTSETPFSFLGTRSLSTESGRLSSLSQSLPPVQRSSVPQSSVIESNLPLTNSLAATGDGIVGGRGFNGFKSVNRSSSSILPLPEKRKEEIYLAQAQLMQWYLMGKRANIDFTKQESLAQSQFRDTEKLVREMQSQMMDIQKRVHVVEELKELESLLGAQRDTLVSVATNVANLRIKFDIFTESLDRKVKAQNGPAANSNQLSQWQSQIKECQRVLELIIRHPKRENEPAQRIAKVMVELCAIVKQELEDLFICSELLARIREVENIESGLLATGI